MATTHFGKLKARIIDPVIKLRFVRFGVVGFSGTIVNQLVLFVAYEHLFAGIATEGTRLNVSLGLAIFLATINNFIWNRGWTWGDRKEAIRRSWIVQLGQYFVACWVAIVFQFIFTNVLEVYVQYMVANIISIVLSAVLNYFVNDLWTFAVKRVRSKTSTAL